MADRPEATTVAGEPDPWVLINTPIGEDWSGRTRYAAAMHFYKAGAMNAETLEVYRICSRLDRENPLDVLRRWKIGADWVRRFEGNGG